MSIKLKTPAQIEAMREAGRVSALALRRVGEAVECGITTRELDDIAEKTIRAEGGIPAFKGYGGFPGSICASVNAQIVHGIRLDLSGGGGGARGGAPSGRGRAVHVGRSGRRLPQEASR